MENIQQKTFDFLENEIYNDTIFQTIIDKMIINDSFDFFTSCALYLQKKSCIFALSEWQLLRQEYLIQSTAVCLILPIKREIKYIKRGDEEVLIENISATEKENFILKKLKIYKNTIYQNYVFFDLNDTNADDIEYRMSMHQFSYSSNIISLFVDFFAKTGVECIFKELVDLGDNLFFSDINSVLYISENVKNKKNKSLIAEFLKIISKYVVIKTTTQSSEIANFETDLLYYILTKKFNIKATNFTQIPKNIPLLESVDRCFKMSTFILSKLVKSNEETAEDNQQDNVTTATKGFKRRI